MRELKATTERWYMKQPFTITGYTFTHAEILYVTIAENGVTGQGEAAGVYYLDENGESMLADVESVRRAIENGAGREDLLSLLPAGGARNALDCALWDLEAKLQGTSIWALTGLAPGETVTVNTVGIGTP